MPRQSISNYWKALIRDRAENSDDSADAITAGLEELSGKACELGVSDPPPKRRTVSRYVTEFRSGRERSPYRLFYWPGCMGDGEHCVPWEASRAALDLLAYILSESLHRPPVILVRNFWTATLAAPDADVQTRLRIATRIALDQTDGLEKYVGFAEWEQDPRAHLPPLTVPADAFANSGAYLILRSSVHISTSTLAIANEARQTGRKFAEVEAESLGFPQPSSANPPERRKKE